MLTRLARTGLRVLTSYGLACVVLVLLLLLTFLGTLEQAHTGIFDVQKKYFESIFLVHRLGGVIPVPLPGGALLMSVFAVNLMLGGVVRVRKDRRTLGILVGHAGILMLLVGSLVKFALSVEGNLMLYEGQSAGHFESYFDWELTVRDAAARGTTSEYVVPLPVHDLEAGKAITYRHADLPFDLVVVRAVRNSRPMPAADVALAGTVGSHGATRGAIDGFSLEELPRAKESERNVPGIVVEARSKSGGPAPAGLLWGLQQTPVVLEAGGRNWALDLQRRRFGLPFAVRLDHFVHEEHPGTRIASDFTSHATRFDGPTAQPVVITMNEPLRHRGYTLYQSSWGPEDARPGEPVFSVFSVVRNPADRWPLWSCIVIAMGLLLHFSSKLSGYLRAESGRRV